MRLLFANPHSYLPDSTSGREISIHSLALRWRASGVEVAVFAERAGPAGRFERDDSLGYPVFRAPQAGAVFYAVLADWRPDVAIYPFGPRSMPLVASGLQAGVKAVLHVTNIE